MSDEPLTREESEQVAELVMHLLPWLGVTFSGISDDAAELMRRGMHEVKQHQTKMHSTSIVYMAMGIGDPTQDAIFKRRSRNVPIVLKALELYNLMIESMKAEAKDAEIESQRNAMRQRLGLT